MPNHVLVAPVLTSSPTTPPAAVISVLGSLLVNCNRGCNRTVQARQYKAQIGSQCKDYYIQSTHSPSKTIAAAILQKKDEAPVTDTERR